MNFHVPYQLPLSSKEVHFLEETSSALALVFLEKSLPKEEAALKYCLVGTMPAAAAGHL